MKKDKICMCPHGETCNAYCEMVVLDAFHEEFRQAFAKATALGVDPDKLFRHLHIMLLGMGYSFVKKQIATSQTTGGAA